MWFEQLTGFREESAEQVRKKLLFQGNTLKSRVNGKTYTWGQLEISSLSALRKQVAQVRNLGECYPYGKQ